MSTELGNYRTVESNEERVVSPAHKLEIPDEKIRELEEKISELENENSKLSNIIDRHMRIVSDTNVAVYIAQDGMIKAPNPKTLEMYGVSEEELTSKPFTEFIHPDDREIVSDRHERRLRGEDLPSTYTFRIINGQRQFRHVELNVVTSHWGGRPATCCFQTDVTERVEIEQRLIDSEDQYRSLVELSPNAILVQRDGIILFANPAAVSIFGAQSETDLIGTPISNLVLPEFHPQLQDRIRLLQTSTEELPSIEFKMVGFDGQPFDIEAAANNIVFGREPAIQAMFRDISERKRTEEAKGLAEVELRNAHANLERRVEERTSELAEEIAVRRQAEDALGISEIRHRYMLENSPFGIAIIIDGTGKRLYCNPKFNEMFAGDPENSLVGTDISDSYVDVEDLQRLQIIARAQGYDFDAEVQRKRLDGSPFWCLMSSRPIDYWGEKAHIVWHHDITDQVEAGKALGDSVERHRQFAADAAHELRTPLAVLRLNLDSVKSRDVQRSLREDVDTMTRTIEQLLAVARVDSLQIGVEENPDLNEICGRVAEHLAQIAIRTGHSIKVVGSDRPVFIRGNPLALEQAVRNLVENAIQYSGAGCEITIKIGDQGTIDVIDRGPGIPAARRDRIFERFVSADRKSTGAGLGLSIVGRTVEAHGGTIEVEDTPGGGATFKMSFPTQNEMND
jgi:PAS domain S-box-containing protein